MKATLLADHIGEANVSCFETTEMAIEALKSSDRPLLVVGSFFTVAEAMVAMSLPMVGSSS